jgi:hypothetical protein
LPQSDVSTSVRHRTEIEVFPNSVIQIRPASDTLTTRSAFASPAQETCIIWTFYSIDNVEDKLLANGLRFYRLVPSSGSLIAVVPLAYRGKTMIRDLLFREGQPFEVERTRGGYSLPLAENKNACNGLAAAIAPALIPIAKGH